LSPRGQGGKKAVADAGGSKPPEKDGSQTGNPFEEAMQLLGGVRRLEGPTRLPSRPPPVAAPATRARREAALGLDRPPVVSEVDDSAGSSPALTALDRAGERFAFVADGIDRATLRGLEDGSRAPEVSLDLHGLKAPQAEARLNAFVRGAHQGGRRVLHIIHGRGLGSRQAGPVLRTLVINTLTRPPLAALILAIVSAPPGLGGPGAALILMRRRRSEAG
jgi:DNA-nicking Smr family endonuclease